MSDDLIQAAFEGDLERLAQLLDGGADLDEGGQGPWNPVHAAIENGEIDAVRLLVGRGADVHRFAGGLSPLVHAVDIAIDGTWQCKHSLGEEPTGIIQVLLDAGADPLSGLEAAQEYGSQRIVDLLTSQIRKARD